METMETGLGVIYGSVLIIFHGEMVFSYSSAFKK